MPHATVTRTAGLALALLMLVWAPGAVADEAERFRSIYEREWAFRLQEFPLLAARLGHEEQAGRLGAVSEADQARRHAFWKGIRAELEGISCERLDRSDCIDYRIFRRQVDDFIADYETGAYRIPFNSDWAFYMAWTRLPEETRFEDTGDYRDYLSRLHEMPRMMDEYVALMRAGLETGMTQPRVVLDGRDGPIRAQLVENPEDSAFYAPFRGLPESVAGGDRAELLATAKRVVGEDVIPAFRRLLAFMEEEYGPGARSSLAATDLPGGERFYAAQIRRYATVEMTPREIHQLGLDEVARIRAQMQAIIEEVGFDGDLAAFIDFLRTDPQFYAKTPRELLAYASYVAKKVDGRLPSIIGHLPRQPYGVAPVPKDIAPFFTAGRYVGAPLDAHRGGYYWVNTHALESRPLYAIPALTLHEAAPGHHTQAALAREQDEQPPFRRYDYISAYGEGWALYAERLGVDMDIYETPYEHFGRLTYDMWRACRLVIDTGIHALGWSRQRAIDYLASHAALSLHEVTTEIDRYISWPAQALSYKIGEVTIRRLRERAERELGEGFDLREFHDRVLALGSVPLDVLEDEIGLWIDAPR